MKDEKISDIITTTASVLYARMTEDQTVQPAWRSIQDFIEAGTVDVLESYRDNSKHVIGAALYDRHADLLRQKYSSAEQTDQTAIDQNQAAVMFWNSELCDVLLEGSSMIQVPSLSIRRRKIRSTMRIL